MTPTPPAPTVDPMPRALLLMLQPWKCTDETMEIVIKRSHLQVRRGWGVPRPARMAQRGSHSAPGAQGGSPAGG